MHLRHIVNIGKLSARFIYRNRGSITIMTAILMPMILGLAALSIDYGLWLYQKRQLQTIADAAAIGATIAIKQGKSNSALAYATTDAALNGFVVGGGKTLKLYTPPTSGTHVGNQNAVEVVLTMPTKSYFSTMILPNAPTISCTSVATATSSSPSCVVTLGATNGITLNGNGSIYSPSCGVYVNSTLNNAIQENGNASITATTISTVGGISGSNLTVTNGITTGAAAAADPYASVTMPAAGSCTVNNFSTKTTQTINPGTYCGGFNLGAKANVTMNPGTYIINGGSFSMNGQATLSGTGVTIVLTGSSGNYASVSMNGGATVNLSAPTSGSLKSILFFGDKNATSVTNSFGGGASMNLNGVIYTPSSDVTIAGNSSASSASCTQVVSNSLTISGASGFGTGSSCAGGSTPITTTTLNLAE
jgi:Flp pilus assembly protein TadG